MPIFKAVDQKNMMYDPIKENLPKDKEIREKLRDYVAQVRPILTYMAALRTNIIGSRYSYKRYLHARNRLSHSYGEYP
jgi:type IV secretory pathway TrbF-like protein